MALVDALFGPVRSYRRWRGGVWERWNVEGAWVPLWFGPLLVRSSEMKQVRDGVVDALKRGSPTPFQIMATILRVLELERPDIACRGRPLDVEDYRRSR